MRTGTGIGTNSRRAHHRKVVRIPAWVADGAVVWLDFVNRQYFWGGRERTEAEFTAFTGGSFTDGLVLAGAARDISFPFSASGLAAPFSVHASFIPATVGTAQFAACIDNGGTSNYFAIGNSTTSARLGMSTTNVSQALIDKATSVALNTRVTVGGHYATNNILQSVDGGTGGTADTSATLFSPTVFRVGERVGDSNLFNGTICLVAAFNGAKNQTQLNTENAVVHAAVPAPTPAHEWLLSQASISSTTAADSGSSPVNATIVGTLTADDSPAGVNTALRSETSGYLTLPSSCLPALDSAHSWSAFVRLSNLDAVSTNGSTIQTLYSDYKDATNGIRIAMYRATGVTGRLKVSVFKASGNVRFMTDAQAGAGNNRETHVGYTWSGTAFVFYVDGVAVAASSAASESKPDGNYIMARTASLGQIGGSMANVRIWNRVLSALDMAAVVAADVAGQPTPYGGVTAGRLRFQDNFYGSSLSTGKWLPNWFGASNSEVTKSPNSRETAACDPAQVSVASSELSLTTVSNPITVDRLYPYRSGLLMSRNKFDYLRGYIEARIYMPSADGLLIDNWPAFWTNGDHVDWPDNVENDIVEGLDGVPRMHYHAPDGLGGDVNESHDYAADAKNQWRVFGCRVNDNLVEYFVDGVKVYEITADVTIAKQWVVINNGMSPQNDYGGPVVVGSTFKCDWIRFWDLPA